MTHGSALGAYARVSAIPRSRYGDAVAGFSGAADLMVETARRLGKPVYRALAEIPLA